MGFHLVSSLLTLSDLERSNRGQQLHFRLLLKNCRPDSLQNWWGRTLGGCLPSLFTRGRCDHFLIFYEFFRSFFWQILKNLLLRNRQADFFEITHEHSWGVIDLNLFTRWRCDFFQFFYDFFCVKAIFDFFSRTKVQISPKSTPI